MAGWTGRICALERRELANRANDRSCKGLQREREFGAVADCAANHIGDNGSGASNGAVNHIGDNDDSASPTDNYPLPPEAFA